MSDHGYVIPRADGVKARCGGPALCDECRDELIVQNERLNHFVRCTFCNADTERNQHAILTHLFACNDHPVTRRLRAAEHVMRLARMVVINSRAGLPPTLTHLEEGIYRYEAEGPLPTDVETFNLAAELCKSIVKSAEIGVIRKGAAVYMVGMAIGIREQEAEQAGRAT